MRAGVQRWKKLVRENVRVASTEPRWDRGMLFEVTGRKNDELGRGEGGNGGILGANALFRA